MLIKSEVQTVDEAYMRRCLHLAEQAKLDGKTAVGSLILLNGKIIAEGAEGDDILPTPLGHAEVVAIVKACKTLDSRKLSGAVLYTTVEPCIMCSYLIRSASLDRVVYGTVAGELGGMSSAYAILSSEIISGWLPINVTGGVLAEECSTMLRSKY